MEMSDTLTIIAAVNDDKILGANLLRSPIFEKADVEFVRAEGFPSVGQAYNYGIQQSSGDVLIFAHQDVYLPGPWIDQLFEQISTVEKDDPNWGVLGIVGVDLNGQIKGTSWSTGLSKIAGEAAAQPLAAQSLDELVLIVRKNSNLLFDENLPGWHLYGMDMVRTAIARNYGVYIINAPVIHNSLPVLKFDKGFISCYHYLQKKWADQLPIKTPCTTITRFGWPIYKHRIKKFFVKSENRNACKRLGNPALKAKELSYE